MPTIIAFHPSGYEVRFEVEQGGVAAMVCQLQERRYRPQRELAYTAEGLPLGPRHGVPMQKREKQGDTWYSHQVTDAATGEVIYCRGYASPSSPGFAVLPGPAAAPVKEPVPEPKRSNGRSQQPANGAHGHSVQEQASTGQQEREVDLERINRELFS